jgi:CSLREA domain-containing protein
VWKIGGLGAFIAAVVLAMIGPSAAAATTIAVSTRSDVVAGNDGVCSLREAITAAQTHLPSGSAAGECPAGSGSDTIVLAAGPSYHLTATLTLSGNFAIAGAGAGSTTIDAGGTGRVFDVQATASVGVRDLTITGGRAPDAAAAPNDSPGIGGQSGGGIRNAGTLTLTNVTVTGNRAGNGSNGGSASGGDGQQGGAGGGGGGVVNTGSLTLDHSTVVNNQAGQGGSGSGSVGVGGKGGMGGPGGGILSTAVSTLIVLSSTVSGNTAGAGGAGSIGTSGATGGDGGDGGGIATAAALTLTASTISGNAAGAGGTGGYLPNNKAVVGGAGGFGGGLSDDATTSQTIVDDTIANNTSGAGGAGGDGGNSVPGGPGNDGGQGGGVVSEGAQLQIVQSTIAANHVGAGGAGGPGAPGGTGGMAGTGGGISAFGSASAQNSIVANNSGGNCIGNVVNHGHNLSFPGTGCPGPGGDPKLGPLTDNGGPTATIALLPGSAAIDQIPAVGAECTTTDQRGVQRPQGPACDVGAFEAGVAPRNTALPTISGAAILACSTGMWMNFPQSFAFVWLRDGAPIAGAATAQYAPGPADAGRSISCQVTATNQTGSTSAVSAGVVIPAPPPAIPKLSLLILRPATFVAASRGPTIAAVKQTGTDVGYSDTVAARTTLTVLRSAQGIRRGRACVAPPRHPPKHARRCTRLVPVGSFAHADSAGANRLHFSGRVGGKALAPGRYILSAVAQFGRLASPPLTASFRVKRAAH